MISKRTAAPLAFACTAFLVVAYGTWQRLRPIGYGEALEVLVDGTPDHRARLRCLAIVRDRGGDDAVSLARAAGAALLLEDETGFTRIVQRAVKCSPFLPGGSGAWTEADLASVSLDEPSLSHLLRGFAERNAGRAEAARSAFAQAANSAALFRLDLIGRLAH